MKGYRAKRYPFLLKTMSKCAKRRIEKSWKKVLTVMGDSVNISFVAATTANEMKNVQNFILDCQMKV